MSIKANVSWTFLSNLVYAICQWGIIVILARYGSTAMIGKFSLALAVTGPVISFTNLKLRAVQATDAKKEFTFSEYLGVRNVSVVAAMTVIAALSLFYMDSLETVSVIIFAGMAKSIEAVSDVYNGLLQQIEQMKWMAISKIAKGILSLVFVFLGLKLTQSLVVATLGLCISWLLILLIIDIKITKIVTIRCLGSVEASYFAASYDRRKLQQIVKVTLPLGFVILITSLNTNVPRYFIEHFHGIDMLGIYSAISYIMVAGAIVINALGQAAAPRMAKYFAADDIENFVTVLRNLVVMGITIGLTGILVAYFGGPLLLNLVYGAQYSKFSSLLTLVMTATAVNFSYIFLSTGINSMRRYGIQLPIHLTSLSVLVISSYFFVRSSGILGAPYSIILAFLTEAVLYLITYFKYYQGWKKDILIRRRCAASLI